MRSTCYGHEAPRPMGCHLLGRINRGWNHAYGSILPSSCLLHPSPLSSAFVFLRDLRPPSTSMAAELPPSRFKTTGSLASLRRLMGRQVPGLTCKVKSGAAVLAPRPPATANRRASSLMTMRCRLMRMSLYRSDNSPVLGRRCAMRQPWLTRRPRTGGPWRRPR
jgi:hypothetical protein